PMRPPWSRSAWRAGGRPRTAVGGGPAAGGSSVCSRRRPRPARSSRTWGRGGWMRMRPACCTAWREGGPPGLGSGALAGPWRRDPLGPFGAVSVLTLVVLALDVMTGSRLQLETPFGLSVLEAGRFYGIGNEALGIYGIAALCAAAWLGLWAANRYS